MKIFFRNRELEEYREISIKELEAIKEKADKDSSGGSWGFEVIVVEKIDVENNVVYLESKEFEC